MPRSADPLVTADAVFERRDVPARDLAGQADAVAHAGHGMAARFRRGGKLVAFGNGGSGADAQHVAVEFVHPVIVGKCALPAISLTGQTGLSEVFAHQIRFLAEPEDIALGISPDGDCANVVRGLEVAHERGLLTVALAGGDGGAIGRSPAVDHLLLARSRDPRVVREVHVTTYHVLWELVHVFFDRPGVPDQGR